ncbi:MAG TPA: hypothetical protein DCY91_14550, partial [Cyanobacteria bacterium UBA11370]|nr:hypothetical protein [Cyanobacteria bacterium UBA11370]
MESHYRILVSNSDRRPEADLYAFNLQDAIPSFLLPLRGGEFDTKLLSKRVDREDKEDKGDKEDK